MATPANIIATSVITEALEAANFEKRRTRRSGNTLAADMYKIDISPVKFAQFIADYLTTEQPASTTNETEQEPPATPAIGDTIAIRDAQPGMTVKIGDGQKRFHGKVETVLTVGY